MALTSLSAVLTAVVLQTGGLPLPESTLGKALVGVVILGVGIVVARFVLSIAWRVITIVSVVIGLAYLYTAFIA
ncbi:hypothetical protein BRD17_02865 [Halobacteriales archaeon SW_7_68_16]|nr:MAG: hypothetical protein BRD17_02865 [Halobacteriales archaeon SW_7_68_16]